MKINEEEVQPDENEKTYRYSEYYGKDVVSRAKKKDFFTPTRRTTVK